MQEIFNNIKDEVKEVAEIAWKLALMQKDPMKAAKFLNTVTEYYKNLYSEEEIEFLQFYFQMKMEMMKE